MSTPDHAALLAHCREQFAATLVAAVSETGIRSAPLLDTLSRHAGIAFDELAGLHSKDDYKRLRSMTASRISLVHLDDMDLTVALINLSHNLADGCERELPRLQLLFMRLLGQDSAVQDQLPVGADAVCLALRAMCDEGELTGEVRLNIPGRVEQALIVMLRGLYAQLTETLQTAGVVPQSLLRADAERRMPYPTPVQTEGMGYGDGAQISLGEARAPDGPLGRLQGALMRRRGGTGSGGGADAGGTQIDPSLLAAILERVLIWLNERQQTAATQPYGTGLQATGFAELNALLPAASNAALDAVGLSFDALVADPELCAAIKPSLERLRLPLTKLALLDAGVLTDAQHPARRMLDTLLRLATTLTPATPTSHPVCEAIEAAAHRVQRDFDRDLDVFASTGATLLALEDARREAFADRAAALVGLAEHEARREHSRSRAARAIRALCAGDVPVPVRAFLEQLWVRVLAAIHQHAGEKCEPWLRALATANQLVDSVQPKADVAARQQLVASLPKLLANLRAGLDAVGTPEALRERAFQSFVECHTAIIQGRPVILHNVDRLEISTAPRIEPVADIPGLRVLRLAPDFEAEQSTPDWVSQLSIGSWLQLTLPDEAPRRLCVIWFGSSPRLLLATDPDSDATLLFPQRWLIARIGAGCASPVRPEGVFERAAEVAAGAL